MTLIGVEDDRGIIPPADANGRFVSVSAKISTVIRQQRRTERALIRVVIQDLFSDRESGWFRLRLPIADRVEITAEARRFHHDGAFRCRRDARP